MYEDLYQQNKGLLHAMARRWAVSCKHDRAVSVEDLAQAGFFGLVKAAETFDEAAGKSWACWASWFIRREFERALSLWNGKPTRPHFGALPLDAPLSSDDEEGGAFIDQLPDESLPDIDAGALNDDLKNSLRAALEQLRDPRGRQIVQCCDLDRRPFTTAADALGISVERVRQIRNKALKALRKDEGLRAHAERLTLDDLTRFHAHKGVAAFNRDLTSVTEGAALWRIQQRRKSS